MAASSVSFVASSADRLSAVVSWLPGGVVCLGFFGAGRFAGALAVRRLARWLGLAASVVPAPFPGGCGLAVWVGASSAALSASPAVRSAWLLAFPPVVFPPSGLSVPGSVVVRSFSV